ncbi:N-acetyltransferase [Rhizobium albus]|nr:N-acetyltransferase [Rhizobium albus]
MTPIETDRLILRNWVDSDRALFHEINSDEAVMRFFEFRRNRAEADAKMDEIRSEIDDLGYGFAAVTVKATGEPIGFAGIRPCSSLPHYAEHCVEIGWRLAERSWRNGYASEAAEAWLAYGFDTLGLNEIMSYAVHDNHASTGVMRKIGMQALPEYTFDYPGIPDELAHLRQCVVYRITREQWAKRRADPVS